MAEVARRLRIHGRVQGVFYRAWTAEQARALGIGGWVRNRSDGTVEVLAIGPEDAVADLVGRCRQGPPAAEVERIEESDADPEPVQGFEKRPTT